MLIFRHQDDIPKARLPPHLAQYIDKLLTSITASLQHYDPEDDGHIILITPKDVDINLCERIGRKWSESAFEGVSYSKEFNCYHAIILQNNQFAVSIIIPREAWLDPDIRDRICREIE
jgi:hypothetical protein